MRAILLIEVLAIIISQAAGVVFSERSPEQQRAIEEIQYRMETFHYRNEL